jgi:peptide-methionine (S)-S-oxide reductase
MKAEFMKMTIGFGGAAALGALLLASPLVAEKAVPIPAAIVDAAEPGAQAVAVFAGGCFWGVEAVFENVKGVKSVVSGYAGGSANDANYAAVSAERTRHAEAVRVVYNPRQVSYATLLRVFFSVIHDPTQLNRQGPDVGPSYRSAIFPQSPAQDRAARAYITQLSKARSYARPIVTRIEAGRFYPAEPYHQDFMRKNPAHPYIVRWDRPKLAAYKAAFPALAR